jgi:2-phospho-L-lactate/phosphoenolpyruvate guanylyltransferase
MSGVPWTIVVPLKVLPNAKSRLIASLSAAEHAELVQAIRADTLAVARRVARVVVVADLPSPEADLVQRSPGLNGAVRDAGDFATRRWPHDGVVALVGDLPALRMEELSAALVAAHEHRCSYVADAAGTGTTLLAAAPGVPLEPQFGLGSAARHGAFAARIEAGPGLRCDVDTAEDLDAAESLGLGPSTAAVLARWTRNIARSP